MPSANVNDVPASQPPSGIVGREAEQALLLRSLADPEQAVWYVHGIAGIGKTTLLRAFADQARRQGASVIWVDARLAEPTVKGFFAALSQQCGRDVAIDTLAGLAEASVLAIIVDNYESLILLDSWLRETFVPCLLAGAKLYLSAREAPGAGWRSRPAVATRLRTLDVRALDRAAAGQLLAGFGIAEDRAGAVYQATAGHPLATVLAAGKLRDSAGAVADALVDVNLDLAQAYLHGIDDEALREAVEAASIVRRVTLPLLAALLPHRTPRDMFAALRRLPFVEVVQDGLHIHDLVRTAVAAALELSDPARFRRYQRAAWRYTRSETRQCAAGDMWRYTADMIYLLNNPVIREAFFPSAATRFSVDRMQPSDAAPVAAIVCAYEPPPVAELVHHWLAKKPDAFLAIRDPQHRVVGFHWTYDPTRTDYALIERDPIARAWWARHRRNPGARTGRPLFIRRWLSNDHGEAPSEVQAAAWLDIKRMYMEMRPDLRFVYLTLTDPAPYAPVARELGFVVPADGAVEIAGQTFHTAILDMGRDSFDGWISRLLQAEIGQAGGDMLDPGSRRFTLGDVSVQLSPLEFSVLQRLHARDGKPAPRDELLAELWGEDFDGESNVLDAVIRQIRRKLGSQAHVVRTVRGIGYSLEA